MSIEVINETDDDFDERRAQRLAAHVMEQMRVHPLAELCITAVDEETMAELNRRWMGQTGPTDVLAFPMDELRPGQVNEEPEEGVLGDLVLCPSVAARQAVAAAERTGAQDHGTAEEVDLLIVHGILHLLGYDHAEPDEERAMFGRQAELLAQWRDRTAGPPRR